MRLDVCRLCAYLDTDILLLQYISSREFQAITDALNFSTADCHVIGSCDLYTTKAAGTDKKLYKNIENQLESQHESLVRLSASLSPPQIPVDGKRRNTPAISMPEIDLSRDSPFGPLSQISARRTFAYLIATLNASHPDYEFSNILRPSDFRKTSGTNIRRVVDSTLQNMRPRRMTSLLAPPSKAPLSTSAPPGSISPNPDMVWNERMWDLIDNEMDMINCDKYSWEPEDDPFEEETALWSQHYMFFNKEMKRVCYLHFRAFSIFSHSPVQSALEVRSRSMPRSTSGIGVGEGAGKRAQYWLGHGVPEENVESWAEDDDDEMIIHNEDYEDEYRPDLDDVRDHLEDGYYSYVEDDDLGSDDTKGWYASGPNHVRSSSEGVADAMEI